MSALHWPRGRYNGRRIVGFSVEFSVRVNCGRLFAAWNLGEPVIGIGPVRTRGAVVYQHSEGR